MQGGCVKQKNPHTRICGEIFSLLFCGPPWECPQARLTGESVVLNLLDSPGRHENACSTPLRVGFYAKSQAEACPTNTRVFVRGVRMKGRVKPRASHTQAQAGWQDLTYAPSPPELQPGLPKHCALGVHVEPTEFSRSISGSSFPGVPVAFTAFSPFRCQSGAG